MVCIQVTSVTKLPYLQWVTVKSRAVDRSTIQFLTAFAQLSASLKNFLRGWLLVLGLKEGLVECATVCVKIVVILTMMA